MRKHCPLCQQSNPPWARFCQQCGKSFPQNGSISPQHGQSLSIPPKTCENRRCNALINSKSLQCPHCKTLQVKPFPLDVIMARISNFIIGITIFSFILQTVFSDSIMDYYDVITVYGMILQVHGSIPPILYSLTALFSFFITILLGQVITNGQNIGFETLNLHLYQKDGKEPIITDVAQLNLVKGKKAISWAVIETIDMWTLFMLSFLTTLLSLITDSNPQAFFISDRIVGTVVVDNNKIKMVKKQSNHELEVQ